LRGLLLRQGRGGNRGGNERGGKGGEGRGEEAFLVMWPRRFSALNPPLVTLSKTEFSVDEQNLGIEICVHFLRAPRL